MQDQDVSSPDRRDHRPTGRLGRGVPPRRRGTAPSRGIGVPRWTVAAAGAAPALLVVGFFVAATLQPVSYDPLRDTISALAARGAADPWVMSAVLVSLGACYLVTALGLRPARRTGRLLLAAGGVATLSIAAFPTPLHGYSRAHAVAVIAACATMCVWPVLAAHRQHRARVLRLGPNVAVSAVTLGLITWFMLEMGGADLGLAERCAAVVPALWLLPVALGARRSYLSKAAADLDDGAPVAVGPRRFADLDGGYETRRAAAT